MNMKYMDMAILEAKKAALEDEVPVGCVIVFNDNVISKAYNKKESLKIVTGHAEIIALEEASNKMNNWRLDGCDVYITLEPCPMCASALKQARVNHIYCGLSNSDKNNFKIISDILQSDRTNPSVAITNDLAVEKVSALLKKFFENRRK
mgnify:CR=1 FL=1